MSVFAQEWRDCLREHYLHVIRTGDVVTEPTLRSVLLNVGFSEEEVDALRAQGEQERPG